MAAALVATPHHSLHSARMVAKAWPPSYVGLERALARCESPAERRLLVAFVLDDVGFDLGESAEPNVVATNDTGVRLFQQLEIGRYRVDFALVGATRIAIEVDGHEWHERTPLQAERDRARERELLERGWPVARFTAREVERCALRCALEALRIVVNLPRAFPTISTLGVAR